MQGYQTNPSQRDGTAEASLKQRIQSSFDRASACYMTHNQLQRHVATHLLGLYRRHLPSCGTLLDLGCGPGVNSRALSELTAQYVGVDLSASMLHGARMLNGRAEHSSSLWLQGDMDQLPIADQSIDGIFSSLAVQWTHDKAALLTQLARVLKHNGIAVFSTLLHGTLEPLRSLGQRIDGLALGNQQPALNEWMQALAGCPSLQVLEIETMPVSVYSDDLKQLLMGIKGVGAGAVTAPSDGRSATRLSVSKFRQLSALYERYRTNQGLPLTYQVAYIAVQKETLETHSDDEKS